MKKYGHAVRIGEVFVSYSDIALKVLAAKDCGIIRSNAHFWRDFSDRSLFEEELLKHPGFEIAYEKNLCEYGSLESEIGVLSAFDGQFPRINPKVKNNSEKPCLLFYRGDYSLLGDLNKNVAVIGMREPDEDIVQRGAAFVRKIVAGKMVIVSGLALGCDTMAHKACLEEGGKTIAILPTRINDIYPADNRRLAEDIVSKGGLLLSEYHREPKGKEESMGRFVERDRLQAMFAKAVLLIASYRKSDGESGSRHAMEEAGRYGVARYVMYDPETDSDNIKFGLNKDLSEHGLPVEAKVLNSEAVSKIIAHRDPSLIKKGLSQGRFF